MSDLLKLPNEYTYRGLTLNEHDVPPDLIEDIQNLRLTTEDIVVATYPRTGRIHLLTLSLPTGQLDGTNMLISQF